MGFGGMPNIDKGLSPHTRGSPGDGAGLVMGQGSIPAHTGKPEGTLTVVTDAGVYPRTHGEAGSDLGHAPCASGLSPHTRGSRVDPGLGPSADGSIPAHTGKPMDPPYIADARGVYPRTHGEAPPRARPRPRATVYPRTHGEARPPGRLGLLGEGLSPHTRGSPVPKTQGGYKMRSIPAHTGKPLRHSRVRSARRVYPRTHGEAGVPNPASKTWVGLSPHTRGSPWSQLIVRGRPGSIPAHTGKPTAASPPSCRRRVYPRTHGEAALLRAEGLDAPGLSPHTRGSPGPSGQRAAGEGSIPAHTGKPLDLRLRPVQRRVYPRTHGEAAPWGCLRPPGGGLSPHTRGSRVVPFVPGQVQGSIPAHTGKPRWSCRRASLPAVYPRTHGEA